MVFILHLFLFSLLIFPMNLLADVSCGQKLSLPDIDPELSQLAHEIGRHSCSDEEVLTAFCKNTTAPSMALMQEFINSQKDQTLTSEDISGIKIEDESEILINAFRELTTPLHHIGFGLSTLAPKESLQVKYNINPECQKVECAIKKIWGEKMGTQILYTYLAHGYNSSEYSYIHSLRFSQEEMDEVLMALEDLPPFYQKLGWNEKARGIQKEKLANPANERASAQRLSRYSYSSPFNSKSIADATIGLFDLWTTQTPAQKQYTIYHELSHNIAIRLNKIDLSDEWLNLSGWRKISKIRGFDPNEKWEKKDDACFVSGYASEKPQEDFAESVTAYRYVGKRFKEMCPEKYAFIKDNVYQGMEYLNDKDCPK